jgi:hypothetical protein
MQTDALTRTEAAESETQAGRDTGSLDSAAGLAWQVPGWSCSHGDPGRSQLEGFKLQARLRLSRPRSESAVPARDCVRGSLGPGVGLSTPDSALLAP